MLASKEQKWVNYFSPTLLKPNLKGEKFNTKYNFILFITLFTSARTVPGMDVYDIDA